MLPPLFRTALFLFILALRIVAQNGPANWTVSPLNVPALPLAVRHPYLNTWQPQGNNPASLSNTWPLLWDNAFITGWFAVIVVDNQAYRLSGQAQNPPNITAANQTYVEVTATRTMFVFSAGPMQVNATYLSPITPTDFVSQSLPFSYFYITATSTDGRPHNVRVYSDVSGEFLHSDVSQNVKWDSAASNNNYVILRMNLVNSIPFAESVNHALDSTLYYSSKMSSAYTTRYGIHSDVSNRNVAGNLSLSLDNQIDTPPRPIGTSGNWPVLGISMDFGSIQSISEPVVWAIGLSRNPSVQYTKPDGTTQRRIPFLMSAFDTVENALRSFLDNFNNALQDAEKFDASIVAAGSKYSSQYADLLVLSARQVFGSLDITLSANANGQFNMTDVRIFMKNMGGAGSDQGSNPNTVSSVNTVDTLYSAFPAFLYFNPEIAGYLLAPLLEYQDSSLYTHPYAARNLGSAYPNATGDKLSDGLQYGIEETANMLIMTLAYSQATGNGTYIKQHYNLLTRWAQYLVNATLAPINQESADFTPSSNLQNTNQTNLALKGIIGIYAQGTISQAMGDNNQAFHNTAKDYLQTWQNLSLTPDNSHINMIYGQQNTSGLIYNLYADQLLHLNFVPDAVYQALVQYYTTFSDQKYGIPLDSSDPSNAKTNAMMLAASSISGVNSNVRNVLISQVHNFASASLGSLSFSSMYNPTTGLSSDGNSPVQGSMFSLLALNNGVKSISIPKGSNGGSGSSGVAGAIAGGVIGGIAAFVGIGVGIFYYRRKKHRSTAIGIYDGSGIDDGPEWSKYSNVHGSAVQGTHKGTYNLSHTPNTYLSPNGMQNVNMGQTMPQAELFPHGTASPGIISPQGGYISISQHSSEGDLVRGVGVGDGAVSTIGPGASASQVASSTGTSSSAGMWDRERGRDGTSPQQVMLAKQTLVNEELRHEVNNLRRDLEQIREERILSPEIDEAPPSYQEPV